MPIILDISVHGNRSRLIITNIGHRPIAITNIQVVMPEKDIFIPFRIYQMMDLFENDYQKLPKILGDGETVIYKFTEGISKKILGVLFYENEIEKKTGLLKIYIYDGEGNLHYKFSKMSNSPG